MNVYIGILKDVFEKRRLLWDVGGYSRKFRSVAAARRQVKSIQFYWSTKQKRLLKTTRWSSVSMWEGSFGCEFFTWVDVC